MFNALVLVLSSVMPAMVFLMPHKSQSPCYHLHVFVLLWELSLFFITPLKFFYTWNLEYGNVTNDWLPTSGCLTSRVLRRWTLNNGYNDDIMMTLISIVVSRRYSIVTTLFVHESLVGHSRPWFGTGVQISSKLKQWEGIKSWNYGSWIFMNLSCPNIN